MLVLSYALFFKQGPQRPGGLCLEGKERGSVAGSALPAHKQKTGSLTNRKGTAVVTDVGGTDYSRAVCMQIFQAVLAFLSPSPLMGFLKFWG